MAKPGKWFRSFWTTGKKDQTKKNPNPPDPQTQTQTQTQIQNPNPTTPKSATPTKEKKRWSFRRSSATATTTAASPTKDPIPAAATTTAAPPPEPVEKQPALAAAEEEVAADVAAPVDDGGGNAVYLALLKEAAAVKIQSVFRSYLARKALKALRGLVKLQALVRGHLVRKQATATLRCMQALVTAQARARAHRVRSVEDLKTMNHNHRSSSTHRRASHDKIKHSYHDMEENIKIVEMDHGEYYKSNIKSRSSYSTSSQHQQQMSSDRTDDKISTYYSSQRAYTNPNTNPTKLVDQISQQQISPAPSGITDLSPRTCSGHFEDYSFATAQSSPQCHSVMSRADLPGRPPFSFPRPELFGEAMSSYDFPLYPNYMANTESSRAKARSQSAPKQRPEFERQPSRGRRPSVEGRGIPKGGGARMQRSSSHVGSTASQAGLQLPLQYPWSVKLDKSTVSLVDSECGSNCSVFTNGNYPRSVVSYDPRY